MNVDILSKRIELLLEVVPCARRIALLYQPEFDLNLRQAALAEQVLHSQTDRNKGCHRPFRIARQNRSALRSRSRSACARIG